jgi:hypothetical protein
MVVSRIAYARNQDAAIEGARKTVEAQFGGPRNLLWLEASQVQESTKDPTYRQGTVDEILDLAYAWSKTV